MWGSYFFHPEPEKKKKGEKILSRASSFAKRKMSTGEVDAFIMLPLLTVFLARTFGGKIGKFEDTLKCDKGDEQSDGSDTTRV